MPQAAIVDSCFCGSGRTLDRCHELPRRERRRQRAQLDILAEANDLAALFPFVRPRDAVFEAYAERTGGSLDLTGPAVPADIVEEGLRLLSDDERRRIVDTWALRYPGRWSHILDLAGDRPLLERAVVAGAVRVALLERRWLPAEAFAPFEGGMFRHLPANALALIVPPPAVWSMDEAVIACTLLPRPRTFEPEWFEVVEKHAASCVGPEHIERLRGACARVAAQLPVIGMPRASSTVAEGCADIAADATWAEGIAARLLALYAVSSNVASEVGA